MQGRERPYSVVYSPVANMSLSLGGSLDSMSWSRTCLPNQSYSINSAMLCCFERPFNTDMPNLTISESDT